MTPRPILCTRLLLHFVGHCVLAGLATARIILRRTPPPAGLVRMRFAPMSPAGAAVLGAMVTLSPGTTVIDIDLEQREMLLHLLDTQDAAASLNVVRRDFERDIVALFPEEAE